MTESRVFNPDKSPSAQLQEKPRDPQQTKEVANENAFIGECVAVHRLLSDEFPYVEVDRLDRTDVVRLCDAIEERVVEIARVLPVSSIGRAKKAVAINAFLAIRGNPSDPLMRVAHALCEAICY